jgi:hypothetical protein
MWEGLREEISEMFRLLEGVPEVHAILRTGHVREPHWRSRLTPEERAEERKKYRPSPETVERRRVNDRARWHAKTAEEKARIVARQRERRRRLAA